MDEAVLKLQAPIDPSLVGTWRTTHEGFEVGALGPINPRFAFAMTLCADGSAESRNASKEWDHLEPTAPAPFPTTWEVTEAGLLTIYLPIAPMPQYEIYDWIREAVRYDILAIEPDAILLSNRAHDGESVYLLRRDPADQEDTP